MKHARLAAILLASATSVTLAWAQGNAPFVPVNPNDTSPASALDDMPNKDISNGIVTSTYEYRGTKYRREVYSSHVDDVIVVRSEQWDRGWRENEPLHSYEDYYARGVGLIRSVAHNHTRWLPIAEIEQELVEVSFDGGAGAAVAR